MNSSPLFSVDISAILNLVARVSVQFKALKSLGVYVMYRQNDHIELTSLIPPKPTARIVDSSSVMASRTF